MNSSAKNPLRGGPLLTLIALLVLVAVIVTVGKPVPDVQSIELPPSTDVLRNPQFALGTLAAHLGATVEMHAQLPADSLPPANGGVLWMAMPGHLLDPSRVEQIRQWVGAGGTLVLAPVEVTLHDGDPLTAMADIQFFVDEVDDEEFIDEESVGEETEAQADQDTDLRETEIPNTDEATNDAKSNTETDVIVDADAGAKREGEGEGEGEGEEDSVADTEEVATCGAGGDGRFGSAFALGDGHFAWAAPRSDTHVASDQANAIGEMCGDFFCHAVRVPLGHGQVLALADASLFNNWRLDRLDHALFAQRLLNLRSGTTFWIIHDETVPSLAALVWHYAKPALFSAIAALLLWLLAVSARFGPVQPSPQPVRRRLAEHVEAAGLLLARHGAHRQLWQVVHDDFWRRFLRRHPQMREAGIDERMALISRLGSLGTNDVRTHLQPPASLSELPASLKRIAFLRNSI